MFRKRPKFFRQLLLHRLIEELEDLNTKTLTKSSLKTKSDNISEIKFERTRFDKDLKFYKEEQIRKHLLKELFLSFRLELLL